MKRRVTIEIDDGANVDQIYEKIREAVGKTFAKNLDALHDVLSEYGDGMTVNIRNGDNTPLNVRKVFEDLQRELSDFRANFEKGAPKGDVVIGGPRTGRPKIVRHNQSVEKTALIRAMADELGIERFHDSSNNGLQVDSSRTDIRRICTGVDASLPFLRAARDAGADMVLCHHGISWGDSLKRITGLNYSIVKFLMDADLALFACHLPLDAHPVLGNNAQICDALGLTDRRPFGEYHGETIGFAGRLPSPMGRDDFAELVRGKIGANLRTALFGRETIETVGVISGGAAGMAGQAMDQGLDAFIDGEIDLVSYNECMQRGMNLFAAGHYATERFGVRALGEWVAGKFGVAHEFIDLDIPY